MSDQAADPLPTLIAANVVVVAGKGGVGKTTVTAVLARAAADAGLAGARRRARRQAGARRRCVPGIEVRSISASDALDEYLREHGLQAGRQAAGIERGDRRRRTAAPGIDDIVVLGKIKQLERIAATGTSSSSTGRPPATRSRSSRRPRGCSTRSAAGRAGPGEGRAGAARRSRALPGRARDAARDDAGQRGDRDDRARSRTGSASGSGRSWSTASTRGTDVPDPVDAEARPRRRRQRPARGGRVPARPAGDAGRRDRPARAGDHRAASSSSCRCRWPASPPTTSATLAASLASAAGTA